jgi:hypothetical protein
MTEAIELARCHSPEFAINIGAPRDTGTSRSMHSHKASVIFSYAAV